MPPVATSVVLYAVPTCPLGKVVVVIVRVGTAAATVSVRLVVLVWTGLPESVTVKVIGAVAVAVGVPVIAPVKAFNCKPAGSAPLVHVYGVVPPVAARVAV